MPLPVSESDFQNFIHEFESGTLAKNRWHHAEHVAVAFWYASRFDEQTAVEKSRLGIQNLNSRHGVAQTPTGGYHDTWTIFFATLIHRFVARDLDRSLPLIEKLNRTVRHFADFREITRQYYSPERIDSWAARASWVEPDLRAL